MKITNRFFKRVGGKMLVLFFMLGIPALLFAETVGIFYDIKLLFCK